MGLTVAKGAAILKADIEDTRTMLAGLGLSKNIPVGNSDAGSFFSNEILGSIDYGVCARCLSYPCLWLK